MKHFKKNTTNTGKGNERRGKLGRIKGYKSNSSLSVDRVYAFREENDRKVFPRYSCCIGNGDILAMDTEMFVHTVEEINDAYKIVYYKSESKSPFGDELNLQAIFQMH